MHTAQLSRRPRRGHDPQHLRLPAPLARAVPRGATLAARPRRGSTGRSGMPVLGREEMAALDESSALAALVGALEETNFPLAFQLMRKFPALVNTPIGEDGRTVLHHAVVRGNHFAPSICLR